MKKKVITYWDYETCLMEIGFTHLERSVTIETEAIFRESSSLVPGGDPRATPQVMVRGLLGLYGTIPDPEDF